VHRTFGTAVARPVSAAILACAVAVTAAAAAPVPAAWPGKPVRLVVPLAAGGDADAIAVPLAAALTGLLGQPVMLDHRPGLAGDLGTEIVARSVADGYTFLLGSVDQAIAAASQTPPAYDLQRDLAPVTLLAVAPAVVVVDAAGPIAALGDLVRNGTSPAAAAGMPAARRPAATAALADSRISGNRVSGNRISQLAGQQLTRLIPDRGGLTGFAVFPVPLAIEAIRAGSLRPLAVTGRSRSFALPAVPTLAESGVDDIRAQSWYALWAPAGTPAAIIQAMQQGVAGALDRKPMIDTWNRLGFERGGQPPHVLALTVRSDVLNWAQVIKTLGATPQRPAAAGAGGAARAAGS
jgi:tripartite-type tricarboxylate transporter receptor subunit TctC